MNLAAQPRGEISYNVAIWDFGRGATVYFCAQCGVSGWVVRRGPILGQIPIHTVAFKAPLSVHAASSVPAQARNFTLIDVCAEGAVIGNECLVVVCGSIASQANAVESTRGVVARCVVPADHSGSKLTLIFVYTLHPPVAHKSIVANTDLLPISLLACSVFMAGSTNI